VADLSAAIEWAAAARERQLSSDYRITLE